MRSSSWSWRIGLLAVFLGLFLMQLDASIVNIALNAIRTDLTVPGGRLPWVVDAYTLPIAALMLTIGTIGDRIGHRRLYVTGLVVFLAGTIACAASPTFGLLVASRAVQGVGAASLAPASLALLMPMFPAGPARQRAIGWWAGIGGLGFVVGPILGGTMTDAWGWQAAFIATAAGTAVAVLASLWLQEEHSPDSRPVDIAGIVLGAVTLAALVTWLIEGPGAGWTSQPAGIALAVAVLGGTVFVRAEHSTATPMLPLRLFRSPDYVGVNLATVAMTFGAFGMLFIFGIFLQAQVRLTPFRAGMWLLPMSIAFVITSGLSERVVRMIGERVTVAAALVAHAVTLAAWLALGAHPRFVMLLPVLIMHGICIGLEMAPLVALGVAALPARDHGLAAGVVNTSRQVGAAMGTALLGSIYGAGGWDAYRTAMLVAIVAYLAGGFAIRSTRRAPMPLPVGQTGGADD